MLLKLTDLKFNYDVENHKQVKALRGLSLCIDEGQMLSLVGESGCGKTTLCNILNLCLKNYTGHAEFWGTELNKITDKKDYYTKVQYIFQDPKSAVSPYQKLSYFMAAPLINLKGLNKFDAFKLISRQLPKIGLHPDILNKHSNEVSLGQLQRLCLLKSLIIKPNLLLCDEITASLDPLSARECLKLIKEYQNKGMSVLFITHDFNLAKSFCKRLAIMFKGMILEDLQDCSPQHPYTKELEKASDILSGKQDPILLKQNNALSCPISIDSGCPYYKRCAKRIPQCLNTMPELISMPSGHSVRCLNILEI